MRIVFVGASDHVVEATRSLIEKGHEVILIEEDEKKIEPLTDQLDCGLLTGDGTNPELLQETNPKNVDFLFGLTDSDPNNILIGLVGKTLEFKKVIISVRNVYYEKVCNELGLENVLVPSRAIGRSLLNFVETEDNPDLKDYIKDDTSLFKVVISKKQIKDIEALDLPSYCRAICLYRDDNLEFITENTKLKVHDEVIILTKKDKLQSLKKKFGQE